MACEVCEHCHGPVASYETFKVRQGYSYHEKCIKCYVCSETNLHNADVFKGVIFCSSCSHRIFQGCSTAKRTKNSDQKTRDRSHKRRSHRTRGRRTPTHDGILELTTYAMSTDSTSNGSDHYKSKQRKKTSTHPIDTRSTKEVDIEKSYSMKKFSVEMGMTTEVTQELLKQMNCPFVAECKPQVPPSKPHNKPTERKKKQDCDPRIAGLGTSTEIANLALKNKYEKPVIIKSQPKMGKLQSLSASGSVQDSDESRRQEMDSAYSSLDSTKTQCFLMDRRLGSIMKLPYKSFKRHILDRSSLISLLESRNEECTLTQRIRDIFHEEITEHQKRGLRRLYSTVNRKKIPNKLGWLSNEGKANTKQSKRCKHFKASHSYRCMRAHVMKLAGPTASELATFRNKVRNIIAPGFMTKTCAAITMSQACGNSVATKD